VTTPDDPDQIRRDIERTQADLSSNVNAFADKVSPGRIVERRVDRAKATVGRVKDTIMGSDPRASAQHTGRHVADTVTGTASTAAGTVSDVASTAAGTVSDEASTAAGSVSDVASTAAGAVSEVASTAAGTVSDVASTAAQTVQEAPHVVRRQARGNPLAAGLIAFGAGWLISSLLPATRREQELAEQVKDHAGELTQPLADAAGQAVGEVRGNLTEPVQQAVDQVRSTATEAGQTVAEESRSAAEQVKEQATDSAGTIKQNSPG
jgi:phage-related protein